MGADRPLDRRTAEAGLKKRHVRPWGDFISEQAVHHLREQQQDDASEHFFQRRHR